MMVRGSITKDGLSKRSVLFVNVIYSVDLSVSIYLWLHVRISCCLMTGMICGGCSNI